MNKKESSKRNNENGRYMVTIPIGSAIFTTIATAILAIVTDYLALPARTIHSSGYWWFWIFIGIASIVFSYIGNLLFNSVKDSYYGEREVKSWSVTIILVVIVSIGIIIFFLTSISGWKIAKENAYASLIDIKEGNFETDIPQITNTAVIVDMKTAQKLGDRTIGTLQHASWYEADDEYNLISVNGEKYRISSIKYKGLLTYNRAKNEGIPGYILVNALTQEATYMKLPEAMKYAPSAFWKYDLSRHLRKQYPNYLFGKSFFEVNDEFNPYWITNVRTCKIGMRGAPIATSIVITNAVTGESTEYNMDEIPDWVDHANSVDYLMTLVGWHYRYQEGWWNPSNTNVFRTSYSYRNGRRDENDYTPFEGYNSMLDKEGNIWFYTGITPANAAETNVGFILTSPKSGEVRYYKCEGAEESSAQGAAEGLVQNLGYSASFPNIINVEGIPTYFMVLKDDAGLVQRYALSSVSQYQKVVQSGDIEDAIRAYKSKIGLSNEVIETTDANESDDTVEYETVSSSGIVKELTEAQINGYTYYYFILENDEKMYMSSIVNSNWQPLKLKIGVKVEVDSYADTQNNVQIVTKIDIQ